MLSELNAPSNQITVTQNGVAYADVQVDGQFITLTSGAVLTVQGVAFGHLAGHPTLGNIANLTAASSPTTNYDVNMVLSATGADTLSTQYVNHNFGLIEATGAGNSLSIQIQTGGAQTVNGLYNYGEILAGPGGSVKVAIATPGAGSSNTFGNAGYIVVEGGTFTTSSTISDGANVPNAAGTPDGYIEIGGGGTAALLGSVASSQQVIFTDTLHNFLTIANHNSFAGSVAGFGAGDTIQIAGITGATRLGYSGSLLTVGELNSGGTVTTTVTIDVGTGYSLSSFGSVLSTGGLDIQAPSVDAANALTFTGTAGTISSFEDRTKWAHNDPAGTLIPGGETVIIAAGTASISSAITETNSGTIIVSNAALIDTTSLVGNGIITIQNGGQVTLANSTGTDSGQSVVFGAGGTSLALNTLDLTGSTLGFGGTISGFGLNDDIVLGNSVLPAVALGSQVSLSYAGSLLTVAELNTAGSVTASSTLDVGTGYSASSFVALLGTNGVNIETPATVIEAPLTFSGTAGTLNSFEDPTKYVGHLAPGSSIVSGETVLVVSGTASIASTSPVANSGTINVTGTSTVFIDAATLSGGGTVAIGAGGHVTLANAAGTDTAQTILFGTGSATTLNGLDINDNSGGFGGTIAGFGAYDAITIGTSVLPAATAGDSYSESYNTATGVLTTKELNAAGSVVGTTTLSITNTGSLTSGSFVDVIGANGVTIVLGSTPLGNSGSLFIDYGKQATLSNNAAVDTIPVTFGTHGSIAGLNILDINGTVTGTNSPYTGAISGFGLNDDIILGPSVLPSVATGSEVTLSYTGSLLTVGELNSGGSLTASTTIDVGTGYSTSSFVALLGTSGVNILTPATAAEEHLTFVGTAGTVSSFEAPSKYAGGLAPGSSIVTGETVFVASGTASITSTSPVSNSGIINVSGTSSVLIDTAALTGTGSLSIATGGEVTLANATGVDTNLIYFGTGGTSTHPNLLDLTGTGTASFAGTIANFGTFDTIVLATNLLPGTETSFSTLVSGGIETLTVTSSVSGTIHTDKLTFAAAPPGVFTVTNSAAGIVIADVPCFAAGTRILTGDGYRAVESLGVGDSVLTMRDGSTQKIIWVGQRTVDLSRHANPEKAQPVRICAGAFAEGLPERDLRVSPDHALFIDGHLIEAKTLVNGVTIIQEKTTRFVTYHHIELAQHDVVLAEGLEAETYLDSANRDNFASEAGPLALHPDFAAQSRALACAPLLTDGALVCATRQKLLDRAHALGFTTTADIDVAVNLDGTLIKPEAMDGDLLFVLPAGAASVDLISATGVPAEISALPDDRRALGLAVTAIALIANGTRHVIALDDDRHEGFYAMENGHRWTNGTTRIALPAYHGRAVLELTINGQAVRWARAA